MPIQNKREGIEEIRSRLARLCIHTSLKKLLNAELLHLHYQHMWAGDLDCSCYKSTFCQITATLCGERTEILI